MTSVINQDLRTMTAPPRRMILPSSLRGVAGATILLHRPVPRGVSKRCVAIAAMQRCPPNATEVVDASSGSFGTELARVATRLRKRCTIYVATRGHSDLRALHATGATVLFVDGALEDARRCARLHAQETGAYMPDQFGKLELHTDAYGISGDRLMQTAGEAIAVVAAAGTGGLLAAHVARLRCENANAHAVAVDLAHQWTEPRSGPGLCGDAEIVTAPSFDVRHLQKLLRVHGFMVGPVTTVSIAAALTWRHSSSGAALIAVISSD